MVSERLKRIRQQLKSKQGLNNSTSQIQDKFDLSSSMSPGQPIPSPGMDITSPESQGLARGVLQTGAAVGAGLVGGPAAAGAVEGLGAGILGSSVAEGVGGALAGELAANTVVGEGTNFGDILGSVVTGGSVGAAGGLATKGIKKALANETVREGINTVISKAGNFLKGIKTNVDEAAERVFSGIVGSRETALNGLNRRRTKLLKDFSNQLADPKDIQSIKNAVSKVESNLNGPQQGLNQTKAFLAKEKPTQADIIRISEEIDNLAFETSKTLSDEVKAVNLPGLLDSKLPQDFKNLNKAYGDVFSEFGDSFDPNVKSFVNLLKQKADGKAVPTEMFTDAVTSTVVSKQAGAKVVGGLADAGKVSVDDLETIVIGKAAQGAKQIDDRITTGSSKLIEDITSGPFIAGSKLDEIAQSGNFVKASSAVDPTNQIPDPTNVFKKFKDDKFTKNFKNLLGKGGESRFNAINEAATQVNRSKTLANEIKSFSRVAEQAGEEASLVDSVLQGFGEAQDASKLNTKLLNRQALTNPAASSLINRATQFTLGQLGPGKRK